MVEKLGFVHVGLGEEDGDSVLLVVSKEVLRDDVGDNLPAQDEGEFLSG